MRIFQNRAWTVVSTAVVLALVATGCGSDASESSEGVTYKFVYASPGQSEALFREAMKNVDEKYGYNGELEVVGASEVAVSGLASGKFDFTAGVASTVMAAQQQQQAPITFVAQLIRSDWVLASKSEITGCADMKGKQMGLHSPGGVSTALYKAWFDENCSKDDAPKTLYVPGSPNRFNGLVADQLDVAMLQLEDTLALDTDKFHLIANFSKDMPWLQTSTMAVGTEFGKEHPEVVQHLIEELLLINRKSNSDPDSWVELLKKYKSDWSPEQAETAGAAYVDNDLLSENGEMSYEAIQKTIDLYVVADVLKPGLKAEDIADRSYLEAALDNMGSA